MCEYTSYRHVHLPLAPQRQRHTLLNLPATTAQIHEKCSSNRQQYPPHKIQPYAGGLMPPYGDKVFLARHSGSASLRVGLSAVSVLVMCRFRCLASLRSAPARYPAAALCFAPRWSVGASGALRFPSQASPAPCSRSAFALSAAGPHLIAQGRGWSIHYRFSIKTLTFTLLTSKFSHSMDVNELTSKSEQSELRNAIIDSIAEGVKTLKKGKPTADDANVLIEIQADCIRLLELMSDRISQETVNLYQVKTK